MPSIEIELTAANKPTESVEEKFHRLADAWQIAVAHHSSSQVRENHPTYREIIAMGQEVVPLLLADLESNRRHWFTALTALTSADPVTAEDAGDVVRMQQAWLRWGREKHEVVG